MDKIKILLVGCGKMGSSMLEGWIFSGIKPANIYVVEPKADVQKLKKLKVNLFTDTKNIPANFNFCLFAVKPQAFDGVVKKYGFISKKCIFISIAAGKNVARIKSLLGDSKIVRAMPNLPAVISAGVTAIYCNNNISAQDKKNTIRILKAVGEVVEVDAEDQIDIVTAISGSGPAYIFHLIECLTEIGVRLGLERQVALALARHTVYGSGKLALESEKAPGQLRADVTSPGGTTEAALKILMADKKLENLLQTAIKAAMARAKELQ